MKKPKKTVDPTPKKKLTCSICDGTGKVCDICGESEYTCTCLDEGEEPTSSDCETCGGKGTWIPD